jgi:hypothetical protein
VAPLASRLEPPLRIAISGRRVTYTDGTLLWDYSLDTHASTVVATGNAALTSTLLADADADYWVRTVPTGACSPPCVRQLERVTADAGTVLLELQYNRMLSLAQQGETLYVEEGGEPLQPSQILSIPKSGGTPTVVVDADLNGLLPAGTGWAPTGGIAVDESFVYFADTAYASHRVLRAPLDGGPVAVLLEIAKADDFDTSGKPLGFAAGHGGFVWFDETRVRTCPDAGTSLDLATELLAPVAAVMVDDGAMVVEMGALELGIGAGTLGTGRIQHLPSSGGPGSVVASSLDVPTALAVDGTSLYWTEAWRVASGPLQGGPSSTLAAGIADPFPRFTISAGRLLVADGSFIKAVPLEGGPVTKVGASQPVVALFDPPSPAVTRPADMVADARAAYVLFPSGASTSLLRRVPLDGSSTTDFDLPGTGYPMGCILKVAVDGTHVYWTAPSQTLTIGCTILRAALPDGPATVLVDQPLLDFALAGSELIFSEEEIVSIGGTGYGKQSLSRIDTAGGPIEDTLTGIQPIQVAADTTAVFWMRADGAVVWAPRSTLGSPNGLSENALGGDLNLAFGPEPFDDLVVVDGAVYWTDMADGLILRSAPVP